MEQNNMIKLKSKSISKEFKALIICIYSYMKSFKNIIP